MTDTILINAKSKIKPGDLVMVAYPLNEQTNNPARKLDGQQFVVKNKRMITPSKIYYELYGAESDKGTPYGFLDDELIKL